MRIKIQPGNNLVTVIYQKYITGANLGRRLAFALMVGTIQDVTEANTLPYEGSETLTRIAITGSIASGNFNQPRAKQCRVHMVFDDPTLSSGSAVLWCYWWGGSDGTRTSSDRFEDTFRQQD
jgi:hypothetical protein